MTLLEFFDLTLILGGLIFFLFLFFLMYIESFKLLKGLYGVYREFEQSVLHSGILIDSFGIFYYALRLIQWQDGLAEYIFVDIMVVIISIALFLMTYPFFLDSLKQVQDVYKE